VAAEPTPAWISIPGLLIVTALVLFARQQAHTTHGDQIRQRLRFFKVGARRGDLQRSSFLSASAGNLLC